MVTTPADDIVERLRKPTGFLYGSDGLLAEAAEALLSARAEIAALQADHAENFAGKVVMSYKDFEEMRANAYEWHRACEVIATIMGLADPGPCFAQEVRDELDRRSECARAEIAALRAEREGEPVPNHWIDADEVDALVRRLDVVLNGPGAARQAKLIDLVAQFERPLPSPPTNGDEHE